MRFWIKDLFSLSFAIFCAFSIQAFTGGYLQESFLFIAICYSLRLIFQITQLERSLRSDNHKILNPSNSIWEEIQQHIFHADKTNKKRQKKLIRIIKKFSRSTAALPDAVVVLGKKNTIDWFNNTAQSVLGLKKKDKGQYILNIIHSPEFINFIQKKEKGAVLTIPSPTQENISLEIKITAYGKNSYLLVAHDISYLKNIERMRKDFVDNISHELRTPLTVLKGYLETLEEMDEDHSPLLKHSLQQMKNQSDRMQSLTDDLLLLANLETGKSEQNSIDISALLKTICQDSSVLDKNKERIQLIRECSQPLLGNLKELHSAFSNLITNALKYSPKNSEVTVRWYKDKDHLILDVIDNGEGISRADLPKITERFYRADVKRTLETRGTGLGLAIVKHVLVRHHAQLKITSQLGKGSTFSCLFKIDP